MIRWSLSWELNPSVLPRELPLTIERINDPTMSESEARIYALNKSQSYGTKPPALDRLKRLQANPEVDCIRLYDVIKDRTSLIWHNPNPLQQSRTLPHPLSSPHGKLPENPPELTMPLGQATTTSATSEKTTDNGTPTSPKHLAAAPNLTSPFAESSDPPSRLNIHALPTSHSPLLTPMTSLLEAPPAPAAPAAPAPSSNPQSAIANPQSPARLFKYKIHQLEDLPRACLHDGAILSWDPGLGKTVGGLTLALLKKAQRSLFVVPASLHDQWKIEAARFGMELITIANQADAYRLMREGLLPFTGQPVPTTGTPRYFITDWHWLGYNGADERPDDEDRTADPFQFINLNHLPEHHRLAMVDFLYDPSATKFRDIMHLRISPDGNTSLLAGLRDLYPDFPESSELLEYLETEPIAKALAHIGIPQFENPGRFRFGMGTHIREDGTRMRCVMAPSLSTLIADCFDFCAADEAVRLKSGDSFMAEGLLQIRSKSRYALTGTPIKNRLGDLFFLASWVTGHTATPDPRWPFGNTLQDQSEFAANHTVCMENLTLSKERQYRVTSKTNQITNVHLLWKLLGPIVLRRRKDCVTESIVPKIIKPISVSPGTRQQQVYSWHVANRPEAKTPIAAMGKQLQILRQAALCPSSPGVPGTRSHTPWTPKLAAILKLAAELMEQREQLVIFSPFQDFSSTLGAMLRSAGVPCAVLDGNVSPKKRGILAQEFKRGRYPVLIAGIKSMGEGHSFECASHLVLPSLEWAYDENAQAIERVHRLNSPKPVTIYFMVTRNSIDERLAASFEEKGDASDLALDGRLMDHDREEVNLAEFMEGVVASFDPTATTIDEEEIQKEWTATLRSRLTNSAAYWRELPAETPTAPARNAKPRARTAPVRKPEPAPLTAPALPASHPAPPAPSSTANPLLQFRDRMAALRRTAALTRTA